MTTKTQLRGNCQCCGREQAVLAPFGTMAKHGYTVKGGWFIGGCSGHNYGPMQEDISVTRDIVATVRADVARLLEYAADLKSGKAHPPTCKTSHAPDAQPVAFAEAPAWAQRDAISSAIYATENRARAGEHFASDLETLANAVHGQPLREEKISAGPAPILVGECRISTHRGILTATSIVGARVSWRDESGFNSRMSSRAWRALELSA